MSREKSNQIQSFILRNVNTHPHHLISITSAKFGISRQAVHRHIKKLVDGQLLEAMGNTRSRIYKLKPVEEKTFGFKIVPELAEDQVWRQYLIPLLKALPNNVYEICHYGFTEMFNNALDHSHGLNVVVEITLTGLSIEMRVIDDGIGIFKNIQTKFGLEDQRHAILELAKGKLTTDPERHTGEGIFFTSRMFDDFAIVSDQLAFIRRGALDEDWLIEKQNRKGEGTAIHMSIALYSDRTMKEIFAKYTLTEEDYRFAKTHVPVNLHQYGDDNLVSRSQAKRLLARFDKFKEVFLDFQGVKTIGRAFADEIFRVFKKGHPHIKIVWSRANPEVEAIIRSVLSDPSQP